ncbi:unnamed protein product [Bemisia tabaci]|uniref:Uncharacterized protein n=1 Tax=Bemisia tabaci TaxID=7038 RepID=A0A9P0A365_BEMTA|nr:unnamed protein product [Bemisia tabaci]
MPVFKNRTAKFRQKLKGDAAAYQEYLQKERNRDKLRRQKKKLKLAADTKARKEDRRKATDRMRLHRRRKIEAAAAESCKVTSPPMLGSYSCVQTLGKAVRRIRKTLPDSPRKKAAAVRKLIFDEFSPKARKMILSTKEVKAKTSLPKDTEQKVIQFYINDKYSWQAPGLKDTISVKNPATGKRTKIAKRYLIMSISELYEHFRVAYPNNSLGIATFFRLRPTHVLPSRKTPHNVCTCIYHENFQYIIDCLARNIPDFPSRGSHLMEKVCCDKDNETCMRNNCNLCHSVGVLIKTEISAGTMVKFRQWMKGDDKRLTLVEIEKSLPEVIRILQDKLNQFKTHYFTNNVQSQRFRESKENISSDSAVMQVDFSEKYALKHQDEAQSAYFNQGQVVIFTSVVWMKNKKFCFAVLSDCKKQDKFAACYFMKLIFEFLKNSQPALKNVENFSDGASSQFKNRFTLSNAVYAHEDFQLNLTWQFNATSHGKGAVDGVGAVLKEFLWSAVRSRKVLLPDAKSCHEYATEHLQGITTFYAPKEEIAVYQKFLEARWGRVNAISKIKQMHFFKPSSNNSLTTKYSHQSLATAEHKVVRNKAVQEKLNVDDVYTDSEEEISLVQPVQLVAGPSKMPGDVEANLKNRLTEAHEISYNNLKKGTYVLVEISSQHKKNSNVYRYVGICQEIDEEEDEVKILFLRTARDHQSKIFKISDEISFVPFDAVKCILEDPKLVQRGDRFYYEFKTSIQVFEKPH